MAASKDVAHANKNTHRETGITLPAQAGQEKTTAELVETWGADAIRDSDGTELSSELLDLGLTVYSTLCLVRVDQDYARKHPDQLPQKYLMSEPVAAASETVVIDLMRRFYREKYVIDTRHDAYTYWEVIDRTTGDVMPTTAWRFDTAAGTVTLTGTTPFHVYTVNFLVFQIWDTTSMYNHLTNNWTGPHILCVDPYHKACWDHLMRVYDRYLANHPCTDVVRLTTLAYHFAVDSDQDAVDTFRDWTGYQDTVSIPALEDFTRDYGYRLRSEDFVDQGYYNAACRVPSKGYLDWMQFIHNFVVRFGKALVDKAHRRGKKTAIFWGDHWVGVEPYQPGFLDMGIDIHVGAAEDGVALRRVSDAPGNLTRELRLYPYFFPDVFSENGDPLTESIGNWVKIRRALLRQPVDRLGYGGYPSLAAKFPKFVEHVAELCAEFRSFRENSGGGISLKAPIKVAVLNCWGKWKPWINSFAAPQKFLVKRPDVIQVAGTNLLECLAGLPVEIDFLSFAEIEENGIPADTDVIVNDGDAETAWSGGQWWIVPEVVAEIRRFVHDGGGFIGCRGPSAYQHQGRYFQLADIMGVDKEVGHTIQSASVPGDMRQSHFITADLNDSPDFGTDETFVYCCNRTTQLLAVNGLHVLAAAKSYGKGRSVFFSGLPYNLDNARLLHRAIFWAANQETELTKWFCTNPKTDCAYYPKTRKWVVVNHSAQPQTTQVYKGAGQAIKISLAAYASAWRTDEQ
ncbi:MAG: 1,3-beta-galactosyl-N-acetylhexosamine phosphorylase [Kiritimatiellales bacterium]|nr:1,3-beta-galactosyl-N-acetylhexosamine phosphorylase [Kiritimatiellales bacterium]